MIKNKITIEMPTSKKQKNCFIYIWRKYFMEMKEIIEKALETGFSYAVPLDAGTIELLDEVRAMCSSNACDVTEKTGHVPQPAENSQNAANA